MTKGFKLQLVVVGYENGIERLHYTYDTTEKAKEEFTKRFPNAKISHIHSN